MEINSLTDETNLKESNIINISRTVRVAAKNANLKRVLLEQ